MLTHSSEVLSHSGEMSHLMVLNMFKVNNKDTRTTTMASFWFFYRNL